MLHCRSSFSNPLCFFPRTLIHGMKLASFHLGHFPQNLLPNCYLASLIMCNVENVSLRVGIWAQPIDAVSNDMCLRATKFINRLTAQV